MSKKQSSHRKIPEKEQANDFNVGTSVNQTWEQRRLVRAPKYPPIKLHSYCIPVLTCILTHICIHRCTDEYTHVYFTHTHTPTTMIGIKSLEVQVLILGQVNRSVCDRVLYLEVLQLECLSRERFKNGKRVSISQFTDSKCILAHK